MNLMLQLRAPLAELGWETTVLMPTGSAARDRLVEGGVPVVTMPLHRVRRSSDPRLHLDFLRRFGPEVAGVRRLMSEARIDVVINGALENPHGALAGHLRRLPVVWQIVGTQTPIAMRKAMMPVIRSVADVVMPSGLRVAEQHPGALEFGDRLFPFYFPADAEHFRPDPERRESARAELSLAADDLVIGNVSNFNPQKGHEYFLRAAAEVRKVRPEVRFVLLGGSHDTHVDYERRLWEEAAALGLRLGDELIVRNPGARVAELAPAFDIFWQASVPRSEGAPTVISEAMAMGLPVVATDAGSIRELVDDGVSGFVVPPLRPDAMANATRPLLDDQARRERLGQAGREIAVHRFTPAVIAQTHVDAFEAAIVHRRERRYWSSEGSRT